MRKGSYSEELVRIVSEGPLVWDDLPANSSGVPGG